MPIPDHAVDKRSDAMLLREAGRDPAAFSVFYARHVGAIHSWLRRQIDGPRPI